MPSAAEKAAEKKTAKGDEAYREALVALMTAFTFLVGMAAIATDIDEELDIKVDALSMVSVITIGRWAFAVSAAGLLLTAATYITQLLIVALSGKPWPECLYWNIAVMIVVNSVLFVVGVLLLFSFFILLTNYRARGPDICPIMGIVIEDDNLLRPESFCGVTGNDLYNAADQVCKNNSYQQFGHLNMETKKLCEEYGKEKRHDDPKLFRSLFIWNSDTTEYGYYRNKNYFTLVDQATAAYCYKGEAWALRYKACGEKDRNLAGFADEQFCATAMQTAILADECQSKKKEDVESCYMHCAVRALDDDESRPEKVVGWRTDQRHKLWLILAIILGIVFTIILPIVSVLVSKTCQDN